MIHDPVVSPVTPVKVTVLQTLLNGYDDAEYLIDGFTHGFKLGNMGPTHSSFAENLRSCQELPQVVATKIEKEVSQGRVKGPFPSPPMINFRISPIGVVPKKVEGQYRLIHHLSYPEGSSVNDFIDDDFSKVQYATFDDAIAHVLMLGKGCLLAKTDLEHAYKLVPIHFEDHPLLGFHFNGQFYYDCTLPMGSKSSCAILSRFSRGLQWLAQTKLGVSHMVNILDDFLFLGPSNSPICITHLDNFISLSSSLGIPIKQEKTERACTCIVFMGLELDSVAFEARLPSDKLTKLRERLNSACRKRKMTLKDLQSLLGLLNFCCKVVLPGRTFLRRLYDLTKKVSNPYHRVTFNKESRRDIDARKMFVEHFNGKHLLLEQRWISSDSLHFYTDAAGSIGFGAVFNSHWFHGLWPEHLKRFPITFKELFPIVLALEI